MSQPAWAAWIETAHLVGLAVDVSRSPLGLRELKQLRRVGFQKFIKSQPAWAAWIETSHFPPSWAVRLSQPAWAAWIETSYLLMMVLSIIVAARLGCVNWNMFKKAVWLLRSKSQPAWAAWIETSPERDSTGHQCRSPLGLRELKLGTSPTALESISSQPAWAAWIETRTWHCW